LSGWGCTTIASCKVRPRARSKGAAQALRTPLPANATPAQAIRHISQLYGGAFAAYKNRDSAAALRYAQAARQTLQFKAFEPLDRIEYAKAAIELIVIEIALGTPGTTASSELGQQATAALQRLRAWPGQKSERASLLAWAACVQANLLPDSADQRRLVQDALQTHLTAQPSDALAWQALAGVYEAQAQTLRSLRASAEERVALLDYGAALDRLKAAQERARSHGASHIDASILDTRTRAVQAMINELQNDRANR